MRLPYFNPRARVGRDLDSLFGDIQLPISIHAPAWGATLPCGARKRFFGISIHAPAWGATKGGAGVIMVDPISIHAPAWGATTGWDTIKQI